MSAVTVREFAMPDVGEGLTEAELVTWHVAVGDTVAVNQVICEIETAKAAVELPCPYAGTIGALLAEPGQTIPVGTPIIAIETGDAAGVVGARDADVPPAARSAGHEPGGTAEVSPGPEPDGGAKIGEAAADGRIATLVGYGPRPGSVTRRPRRTPTPAGPTTTPDERDSRALGVDEGGGGPGGAEAQVSPAPAATAPPAGSTVPLAKPPVRKLARDLGVDLRTLAGAGGVITRADVETAARTPVDPAERHVRTDPPDGDADRSTDGAVGVTGDRREPIRGVRKATAAAMVASAFTAPHVTEFLDVDATATMRLRDRLRGSREFATVKLTPLAFVAKALCLAARRTPEVNAHWDEAAAEIVYHERVQLGIAAATPRGLMVPKIRDADLLSLHGLAGALSALTETARAGRTAPADLVGGTITITNVGVFGVDTGTPILNPGEAAILALGSIKPAPWVVDGELAVRTVCRLALSFDHRLVDGEQGSRFLADVGALLTDPGLALTW